MTALSPFQIESRGLLMRLAANDMEIKASQRLRYQVFCEELSASATEEMQAARLEFDSYDPFCDHLLVFDPARPSEFPGLSGEVIATYRFMRRSNAAKAGGFYTANEFDISALETLSGEVMELGRSCVHKEYRTGPNLQFLWRGIAEYVLKYKIELMFGCASFHATDVNTIALPLAYLHHFHLAPEHLRAKALAKYYVDMNLIEREKIDPKAALQTLPPLMKGYLRLGGFVGEGAVVDKDFGTTDVCIIVKTDLITEKYKRHLTR